MTFSCKEFADVFKALSDETRLTIYCMLSDTDELCGCEILEHVPITQPTLSYHMRLLCDAGLAVGRKDGNWMRYRRSRQRQQEILQFLTEECSNTKELP